MIVKELSGLAPAQLVAHERYSIFSGISKFAKEVRLGILCISIGDYIKRRPHIDV